MINKTYRQHKQRDEKTETEGYRIVQEGIEVKEAWLWHVTEKCRVMQACTQIYTHTHTHTHTHPPHTHTYICTLLHATHIQPYLYSSILLNEFASDFVVVGVDVIVVKWVHVVYVILEERSRHIQLPRHKAVVLVAALVVVTVVVAVLVVLLS